MRPRNIARPAAAGALCLAFTCAQAASAQAPTTQPSDPSATAAAKPRITVSRRKLDVPSGDRTAVKGTVQPGVSGVTVSLQIRRGSHWKPLDRDTTDDEGRYKLRERLRRTGSAQARVRVAGGPDVAEGKRRIGRLNVYKRTYASMYGPGLYGNLLACGGRLSTGTLGVAHKTLPCGTKVTIKRGNRTVRVPVVDRGPFVGGREYDLTSATAAKLGFPGLGTILTTR
ncbi:MAG: septal ring lytic transglycosylase RlpA family protein [Solirubrobacteraceae bacterium]